MSMSIKSAPLHISDNAENEMLLTEEECRFVQGMDGEPAKNAPPCQKFVHIGLFFDGTNNNMIRDIPEKCHTNVVKLFNAHKSFDEKGMLRAPGHYRIYVPGLGTRFPENREWRESQEGKALGKGGEARILFGLLQVYNAVHQAFKEDDPMFNREELSAKIRQYVKEVETDDPMRDAHEPRPDRHSWFEKLSKILNDKLGSARKKWPLPNIPKITLNVFGFSRGSVEARAFCYWFADTLAADGTFAGMPADINFLGLFDSVSSIGLANSASESTPLFFAHGHFSWAGEILKPLPACVKQTVHYIAAHEQRRNFPVTRVKGKNVTEYLYPGVHSDVGGGYSPGDHGRGLSMGTMLSQIPLLHMHHAASAAGVPLAAYCVMDDRLKIDYDIKLALSQAWNNYMAFGKEKFESNSYDAMLHEHMRLLYLFRARWLNDFKSIAPYTEARKGQEQEDLDSYNNLLKGDLAILRQRASYAQQGGRPYDIPLDAQEIANSNLWQQQLYRTNFGPEEEEIWALQQFNQTPASFDEPYMPLLRDQVHDSLATFYMAGYVTDEEKADRLLAMVRNGHAPADPYDKLVWANYQAKIEEDPGLADAVNEKIGIYREAENTPGYRLEKITAMEKADQQTPFTPEEQKKLAGCYPLQTDVNTQGLRSVLVSPQTSKRREGSGYLRQRIVF